jgi:hypothetical protein
MPKGDSKMMHWNPIMKVIISELPGMCARVSKNQNDHECRSQCVEKEEPPQSMHSFKQDWYSTTVSNKRTYPPPRPLATA